MLIKKVLTGQMQDCIRKDVRLYPLEMCLFLVCDAHTINSLKYFKRRGRCFMMLINAKNN